ncbi:MAG: BMP family ABC transporter substrate-binding protein [Ilumatobacteraceae bacterium]
MRKSKKMLSALTITTVLGLVGASCGSDADTATTTAATTKATVAGVDTTAAGTETTAGSDTTVATAVTTDVPVETTGGSSDAPSGDVTACEVTDLGGVDDKGFNQSAYAALTEAETKLGTKSELLESKSDADYATNVQSFLQADCSIIVTVGFLLDSATATAAKANPDQQFAIVDSDGLDNNGTPDDFSDDVALPNVRPLKFATDQSSFLAGYLAAGMSKSGTVATYGGINIPPVTIFMEGFRLGIAHYNEVKGTDVQLLGWDGKEGSFAGNFDNLDDGKSLAQNFADEGADVIFPVAGPVGLGSAAYATEAGGIRIIGVDVDQYVSNPADAPVYLSSVLKGITAAVLDTIKNVVDTGKAGKAYLGTLENDGTGLAEFHDQDGDVPQELRDELDQLKADIIAGDITTS